MSCSDKICRWLHLGLQGALMAPFVESLYLDRIIVGKDPLALDGAQYEALRRALLSRSCGISRTPRLSIPDNVDCFHMGKCNVQHKLLIRKEEDTRGSSDGEELPCVEEVLKPSTLKSKRKVGRKSAGLGAKARPSGSSINWIRDVSCIHNRSRLDWKKDQGKVEGKGKGKLRNVAGGTLEVTQAQAGILQGASQHLVGSLKVSSRLCRRKMAAQLASVLLQPEAQGVLVKPPLLEKVRNAPQMHSHDISTEKMIKNVEFKAAHLSYKWWKRVDDDYESKRKAFLSKASFRGWLVAPSGGQWRINEILYNL